MVESKHIITAHRSTETSDGDMVTVYRCSSHGHRPVRRLVARHTHETRVEFVACLHSFIHQLPIALQRSCSLCTTSRRLRVPRLKLYAQLNS